MKLGLFTVGSKWTQIYQAHVYGKQQSFQGQLQKALFLSCIKQWQHHLGLSKSSQGFVTTKEAWLVDTRSGLVCGQSSGLPLLFLSLPLQNHFYFWCYKTKSLQLLPGFYVSLCCLHLFSTRRAVHWRNQLTLENNKGFKVQQDHQESLLVQSPLCGKNQW